MQAAHLLGAAERQREVMAAPMPPAAMDEWRHHTEALHAALDPSDLAHAWADGRAQSWEEALAEAVTPPGDAVI